MSKRNESKNILITIKLTKRNNPHYWTILEHDTSPYSLPGRFHQTYPTVGYVGLLCSATVGHVSHQSCNNVWEPHVEYSNRQGMRYDKPIAGRCHETLVHICTISEHLQLDETATQHTNDKQSKLTDISLHRPCVSIRLP